MSNDKWALIHNLDELQEWEKKEIGSTGAIDAPSTYPVLAYMESIHQYGEYSHQAVYVTVVDAAKLCVAALMSDIVSAVRKSHHEKLMEMFPGLTDQLPPATLRFSHTPETGLEVIDPALRRFVETPVPQHVETSSSPPVAAPKAIDQLVNLPSGAVVRIVLGVPVSVSLAKVHLTDRRGRPVAPPPPVTIRAELHRMGWDVNASMWSGPDANGTITASLGSAQKIRPQTKR